MNSNHLKDLLVSDTLLSASSEIVATTFKKQFDQTIHKYIEKYHSGYNFVQWLSLNMLAYFNILGTATHKTLCHGDLTNNNMMHGDESEGNNDLYFIDW